MYYLEKYIKIMREFENKIFQIEKSMIWKTLENSLGEQKTIP